MLRIPETIKKIKDKKRPKSTHVFDSVLPLVERVDYAELLRSCEVDKVILALRWPAELGVVEGGAEAGAVVQLRREKNYFFRKKIKVNCN